MTALTMTTHRQRRVDRQPINGSAWKQAL